MCISTLRKRLARFRRATDGAVTVDWVVLSALTVTLMAAGYGALRDGTSDLASGTTEFMTSYLD